MRSNQEFVSTSRPGYLQECFLKFRVYECRFERCNYAVTEQKKIFGTDGVGGVANAEPVTAETALKLGRAAAYVFAQMNPRRTPDGARPKIVLGKDTRLSGYMLENALVAGITSLGVRSEEHTSELQSLRHLVCRLLLEKKKKTPTQ